MIPRRIQGLDGVRAIALLIVLVAHAAATPQFFWPGLLDVFPHAGKFGVLLFFVLSGYLQTRLLLGDEQRLGKISPRRFYAKRLLRIVPLLLVYLAFVLLWGAGTRYEVTRLDVASVLLCFKHVVGGAPLLIHFWSLSLEILFYIAWPLLLLRLPPARRAQITLAIALLLPATSPLIAWLRPDTELLYLSQFFRAEAILLGCWLAATQEKHPVPLRWIAAKPDVAFFAALAIAIAAEAAKVPLAALASVLYFVQVAAAAAVVQSAMLCRWRGVRAVLDGGFAHWLALISFGTYVWQQFFFFGNPNDWLDPWLPRPVLLWSFWFPCNVVLALAAGALSYYAIERPLHAWREKLAAPPAPPLPATA